MNKNITYDEIMTRYLYEDGELYYRENLSSRARKGQMVGSIVGIGYKSIHFNGKRFGYHRVIYCYFNECDYDDIRGWEIDHLDNDKLNNKIENLLLCEHWENQLNRIDTKRNGGVTQMGDENGNRKWTPYGLKLLRERRRTKSTCIAKTGKDT